MLIAPTEPVKLRAIGDTSLLPESFGSDIMFPTPTGLAGIQRKEISDFIASIRDGRLGKELVQMQKLSHKYLVLEGRITWTNEGFLMNSRTEWSKGQHYSSLMSVQDSDVAWLATDSLLDTISLVKNMEKWLQKETHSKFLTREKPKGEWGKASSKDWACWVLQSFEGVSVGRAKAIYDHFNGLPLQWTVTTEELMKVPGIGKKTAEGLLASIAPFKEGFDSSEMEFETDV